MKGGVGKGLVAMLKLVRICIYGDIRNQHGLQSKDSARCSVKYF